MTEDMSWRMMRFVNWLGCPREEVLGRTSAEFGYVGEPGVNGIRR